MGLSLLERYKTTLFSTSDTSRFELCQAIQNLGYNFSNFDEACEILFFELSDTDLQKTLAPHLRQLAIASLKTTGVEQCVEFRTNYNSLIGNLDEENRYEGDYDSIDIYYQEQGKNFVYGQGNEAIALADKLQLNYASTTNDNLFTNHFHSESAETVHLYNQINHHFFVEKDAPWSTIADGNCLYYGFAQHLRLFVLKEAIQQIENLDADTLNLVFEAIQCTPMRELSYQLMILLANPPISETDQQQEKKPLEFDKLHIFTFQKLILAKIQDEKATGLDALIEKEEDFLGNTSEPESKNETDKNNQDTDFAETLAKRELIDFCQKQQLFSGKNDHPDINFKNYLTTLIEALKSPKPLKSTTPLHTTKDEKTKKEIIDKLNNVSAKSPHNDINFMLLFSLQHLKPHAPLLKSIAIAIITSAALFALTFATGGLGLGASLAIASVSGATAGFFAYRHAKKQNDKVEPTTALSPTT